MRCEYFLFESESFINPEEMMDSKSRDLTMWNNKIHYKLQNMKYAAALIINALV